MLSMTQSCATCRWYDATAFYSGPDDDDPIGTCDWPAERLPFSLRYGNRERVAVRPHEGTDCPCYELKEVK